MNPTLAGIILLGVAGLGFLGHALAFLATRRVSLAVLWLVAPLAGAMIAFITAPPGMLTLGLGGAAFVLTLATLAAALVVPVLTEEPEQIENPTGSRRDRAA